MNLRFLKSSYYYSLLLSSLLVLVFGCSEMSEKVNSGEARIRVINVSPEDNKIDFYYSDSLKTTPSLAYGEGIDYTTVSAGTNKIYASINGNEISNTNSNFFFNTNKSYTLFIAGKVSTDSVTYVSLEDNLALTNDSLAKVRFINLSPNSPNLDLVFYKNTKDSVALKNLNFRSGTAYAQIKPNTYLLQLRRNGKSIPIVTKSGFLVQKGKIYTVFAKGLYQDTGIYKLEIGSLLDN